VRLKSTKLIPALITGSVLGLVCLLQLLPRLFPEPEQGQSSFDLIERLEWMTYDARVKFALSFHQPAATNLAAVFIDDADIRAMNDGSFGSRYQFPWPRHLYGHLVKELSAQGATVVAFDILFDQLDPQANVQLSDSRLIASDEFFAAQLKRASNVVLAAGSKGGVLPAEFFRTNAIALGNVYTKKDSDGVLRRAKAFTEFRLWHPAIRSRTRSLNWDLSQARTERKQITFPRTDGEAPDVAPLDDRGSLKFDQDGDLIVNPDGSEVVKNSADTKPYTDMRIWQLGIVMAAKELKLDLEQPTILPDRIVLRGANGLERTIPIDRNGFFHVDWSIKHTDVQILTATNIVSLIRQSEFRDQGQSDFADQFRGKLVVIGSIGTGGNISDQGATPLQKETVLVSKCWNVANSVITGRFVTRSSVIIDLLLIVALGLISAALTWRLRVLWAAFWVCVVAFVYLVLGAALYVESRYWLPLFLPVAGGLFMPYVSLTTYRLVFEQHERRRIKAVFAKIVSPEVVNELLDAEQVSLGGARRHLTVFFADVRGFTEFTDVSQANAEEYVRVRNLADKEAQAYLNEQASEALNTINLYLGAMADTVKKHGGTLDKYIGDCVMAFWGAPLRNDRHALCCVRAAVEAQQIIYALNQERFRENKRREQENANRVAAGQPPLALLPLLTVGTGINTGEMTVGLMGSNAHILNYTVFGREVNLASRLEGLSGRARIYISEATHLVPQRDAPELAATCQKLVPATVKGIRHPVTIYEVPWKTSAPRPAESNSVSAVPAASAPQPTQA